MVNETSHLFGGRALTRWVTALLLGALSSGSFLVGREAAAGALEPSDLQKFKQQVKAGLDKTLCRCADQPAAAATETKLQKQDPLQGEAYEGIGFLDMRLEAAAGTPQSVKRFVSVARATPPMCVVPAFDYSSGAQSTLRKLPDPVKCSKFEIVGFAPATR